MGYVDGLLATNEQLVIVSRQHWRVVFGAALTQGFLFVILIAGATFFEFIPLFPQYRIGGTLGLILLAIAVLPIVALARDVLEWWNEEYVVTNRRVIQARGVLGKRVLDSSLDKINDVKLTQSFLGRIFDYGDLEIDTANVSDPNVLHFLASPVKFKMALMNQRNQPATSPAARAADEPDTAMLLEELDALHRNGVLTDQEYHEKKRQLSVSQKSE